MREWKHWKLQHKDRIGLLYLNRPEQDNSLDPQVLAELTEISALDFASAGIQALILEGAGRHFSVGMDLSVIENLAGSNAKQLRSTVAEMQAALDAFDQVEVPVVAAIRGFCIGGGMLLAACCDLRVASEKAYFSMPEVRMGFGITLGMHRLLRFCNASVVSEMVLLGERFDAGRARDIGFLNSLAQPQDLHREAMRLAEHLANLPWEGVRQNKRILRKSLEVTPAEAQSFEIESQIAGIGKPELLGPLQAYRAKLRGSKPSN